jgi:3D (Asp-Asp-Asp) domain-containing protein
MRRGADDPNPPPTSADSTRFETSITYYYCVPGAADTIGDGGGYCGTMANGEKVHEGAAACSPGLLGQQFIIEGDPTGRTYTCTDTGGSVLQDHRDIWFMTSDEGYAWWSALGDRAFIQIVQ